MSRRSALKLMGSAGLAVFVAACATETLVTATTAANGGTTSTGSGDTGTMVSTTDVTPTFGGDGSCVLITEETAGPYPLDLSGNEQFFRSDITEGKEGVPLSMILALVDVNNGCLPVQGARVDIWHCDADGVYSGYSQPGVDTSGETFCRGIQLTDVNGRVSFQTIYPGWYPGRITHIHFQVFFESGLEATSQIAFPEEVTTAVYVAGRYAAKGPNSSVGSFTEDNVFSDGTTYQMASVSGDSDTRLLATLLVGVAL